MSTLGSITHVSLEGITTALGQSQVLAVSERLQALGWQCTILSLEPRTTSAAEREAVQARVVRSGVRWQSSWYERGRTGPIKNTSAMSGMVRDAARETDVFHGRSYFGGFLASAAGGCGGINSVFDTRGYWIDEKIADGRWFRDPLTRALGRQVERQLYERSSAVVTLTELAAEEVRAGRFGRRRHPSLVACIPTCVDYAAFSLDRPVAPHPILREGPVIGYVGSINPSYETVRSLRLAAMVLDRSPSAKFVALTSQGTEMRALADEARIPESRRLITRIPFREGAAWLPWIDYGLLLLVAPNQAKRASMPTKLGEFLATGVAPICHGGNREIEAWVGKTGSGLVLDDLSDDELGRVADIMAEGVPDPAVLRQAREIAEQHFSLESGANRYDALFREVLGLAPNFSGAPKAA